MSSNISTTNSINTKFTISSNDKKEETSLNLAQKALRCITQEQIAPTEVSNAYQKVFTNSSNNTSRNKVYVAALVFKKAQGYFPESLDELVGHINEHSIENFVLDEPEAAQYLAEITSDADYVTEEDSTTHNLNALRNTVQTKITKPKLFQTSTVTQQTTNATRTNINDKLDNLREQISKFNNPENEEVSLQLESTISLQICTILEYTQKDPLSQQLSSEYYKNLNKLSNLIQKLNNPIKFMLNLCRDVNSPKFSQLSHLKHNMAFLLTKSVEHAIRQIETKEDAGLVKHLIAYIDTTSQFISNAAKTNLYNILTSICLKAQLEYPEGLKLTEYHIRNILEQISNQITRNDAPYLLRFLASAIEENHNNSSIINNSLTIEENHNNYAIAAEA